MLLAYGYAYLNFQFKVTLLIKSGKNCGGILYKNYEEEHIMSDFEGKKAES